VVLARTLVGLRRDWRHAVEVPFTLHAGAAERMTGAEGQEGAIIEPRAEVRAMQGVRVVSVGTAAFGVELVAKNGVIVAIVTTADRKIAMRGLEVAAVGAK